MFRLRILTFIVVALGLVPMAAAQDARAQGRDLGFAATPGPTTGPSEAYGGYAKGCMAGGVALEHDAPSYEVMRPSRNRYYGHRALLGYIQRLSDEAQALGWGRLLVGDLAQPRGGPMSSGHRSHQIGLDADIWLRPGRGPRFGPKAREEVSAISMLDASKLAVDPAKFRAEHVALLRAAASDGAVARIFVNPAIKRALCAAETGDRAWLRKIRPWWGHHYHFHVRLSCPADSPGCRNQNPPPPGDGCGAALDWWFSEEALNPKPKKPAKPRRRLTLADLPPACRTVLRE